MPDVVGVVFHTGGKVYYFDPNDIDLARGERVVVQTMRGTEIGQVVDPTHPVPDEEIPAPLKRVTRRATDEDLDDLASQEAVRREAMATCRELIAKHGLDMKLVDAETVFGGGKITFSFYAEERVDFRALVADLARTLKTRIELRQIGAREEARLIGGIGPCGRQLCCETFQGDQEPVSIRMAKEQNLPLNPLKISGLCGRLMCCLKYEQEQYVCFRKEAPNRGTQVETELGVGSVVGFQVAKDALTVRLEDGSLVDVPVDLCSCGGEPCRERSAEAETAGEGSATSDESREAPSRTGGPATGGSTPAAAAEPDDGAAEAASADVGDGGTAGRAAGGAVGAVAEEEPSMEGPGGPASDSGDETAGGQGGPGRRRSRGRRKRRGGRRGDRSTPTEDG